MKQRSGSSSLSALKLKSFASLVKWCAAHYTRHMKCHVSLRDLYGLCVNTRTDSGKSQAVWMNQNQTIPGWFPEHITRVFSGISVWKGLRKVFVGVTGRFVLLKIKWTVISSRAPRTTSGQRRQTVTYQSEWWCHVKMFFMWVCDLYSTFTQRELPRVLNKNGKIQVLLSFFILIYLISVG